MSKDFPAPPYNKWWFLTEKPFPVLWGALAGVLLVLTVIHANVFARKDEALNLLTTLGLKDAYVSTSGFWVFGCSKSTAAMVDYTARRDGRLVHGVICQTWTTSTLAR